MCKNKERKKTCSSGCTRGIVLVLWKNLQYRKRFICCTGCEIICPAASLLFGIVLPAIFSSFFTGQSDVSSSSGSTESLTTHKPETIQSLGKDFEPCGKDQCDHILAFYPPEAKEFIDKLVEKLKTETVHDGTGGSVKRDGLNFTAKSHGSEEELETFVAETFLENDQKKARKDELKYVAAIVFTKGIPLKKSGQGGSQISYTIRLPVSKHKEIETHELFPPSSISITDAASMQQQSHGMANWYTKSGFTLFQLMLDKLIIQETIQLNKLIRPFSDVIIRRFESSSSSTLRISGGGDFSLRFLFYSSFSVMMYSIILLVHSEKYSGIKELMKIMGLPNWIHWLGWMLNYMILNIITVLLLTIVLSFIGSKPCFEFSNPLITWISFYLYALSGIAFCLFISSLFKKHMFAYMVGAAIWFFSGTIIPWVVDPNDHEKFGMSEVLAVALFPNYAIYLILTLTFRYEVQAIGAQWNNITEPMNSAMPLSLAHVWIMLLADTLVYFLLAVYFDNVLPSEFGSGKPWYYILMPPGFSKLRLPSLRKKRVAHVEPVINPENTTGFEAEPTGLNAGIIVTNLSKQFGRKRRVVNNLSFKMFDGQITALLGHNGAGKTTTMSILTGILAPTSGTATVNGFDVRTQMDKVRRSLGLCPQHNILFEHLSVHEQLIFFGRLKGQSSSEAKKEATSLLQLVGMPEKAKVLAKKLSGGQKRKLCLCMALIGGSKVLILDEPTSGMDPDARRTIWDVLLAMRGSRTILLSTHFMDEADLLGDRIAIMAEGKLQCCGSPEFLKQFYGSGFTLSMTIDPTADKNAIMSLVQKHSPGASWKYKKFAADSEVGIILPSKEKQGSKSEFAPLLSDLTKNRQDLRVHSMGLAMTTMDDVFIKVGELLEGEDGETSVALEVSGGKSAPKSKGCRLVFLQFWALFLLRILYTWKQNFFLIAQIVLPMFLLLAVVQLSNSKMIDKNRPTKLTMKLSDYRSPTTLYTSDNDLGGSYEGVVDPSGKFVQNVIKGLENAVKENKATFPAKYIVAADLPRPTPGSSITAFYSTFPLHAAPLSVNLVSNAILKYLNTDTLIEVSNQPVLNEMTALIQPRILISFDMTSYISFMLIGLGVTLFAGFLIMFPLDDKTCKQLQVMTGVNPLILWGSSFLWDLIVVLIMAGLTVVVLSFHRQNLFTTYDAGGVIFLIVLVSGMALITFAYVCSLILKSLGRGLIGFIKWNFAAMVMSVVAEMYEGVPVIGKIVGGIINIIITPFPSAAFGRMINTYRQIADKNGECNFIPEKFKKAVCELDPGTRQPIYSELYHCCHSCDASLFSGRCHEPQPFLTWTHSSPSVYPTASGGHEMKEGKGILQQLFFMSLLWLFYTIILFAVEIGILSRLKSMSAKAEHDKPPTDEDVIVESQRVQEMIESGQVGQDAFVAEDISKSYGGFAAVSNLSFGVHHGECFGLLGVNGAGKTTAFRILTGDEVSSGGNAYAFNFTLKKNKRKFLGNIGYCPQYDGIIGILTGQEMLELFARLRGIHGNYVNIQATLWLKRTGLYASRNQMCKNYSGGMKRRLSAGMALIGEPRIIMLDEPTSGVDPLARLRFWDILGEARNNGQSIILTSHSMEECEALCTRLGIMVNGQFQCFGNVEHLKTKFALGFSLVLKLKPMVPPESPELYILNQEILQKFDPCELKDQHENALQYQITNKTIGWDDLVKQMEDIKARNEELIEEYSVKETTLEDVFLVLARQQYPTRTVPASCLNKCINCC